MGKDKNEKKKTKKRDKKKRDENEEDKENKHVPCEDEFISRLVNFSLGKSATTRKQVLQLIETLMKTQEKEQTLEHDNSPPVFATSAPVTKDEPLKNVAAIFASFKTRLEEGLAELDSCNQQIAKLVREKTANLKAQVEKEIGFFTNSVAIYSGKIKSIHHQFDNWKTQIEDQVDESSMKVKTGLSNLDSERKSCLEMYLRCKQNFVKINLKEEKDKVLDCVNTMLHKNMKETDEIREVHVINQNSSDLQVLKKQINRKDRTIKALIKKTRDFETEKTLLLKEILELKRGLLEQSHSSYTIQ
eukprot:snap_masked-scaffold_63-processed-gene-0.37-mRNA-1 protein AED:1.00 eAED:1.00 QI:0/-1/0/0/-1/1/1/0/301